MVVDTTQEVQVNQPPQGKQVEQKQPVQAAEAQQPSAAEREAAQAARVADAQLKLQEAQAALKREQAKQKGAPDEPEDEGEVYDSYQDYLDKNPDKPSDPVHIRVYKAWLKEVLSTDETVDPQIRARYAKEGLDSWSTDELRDAYQQIVGYIQEREKSGSYNLTTGNEHMEIYEPHYALERIVEEMQVEGRNVSEQEISDLEQQHPDERINGLPLGQGAASHLPAVSPGPHEPGFDQYEATVPPVTPGTAAETIVNHVRNAGQNGRLTRGYLRSQLNFLQQNTQPANLDEALRVAAWLEEIDEGLEVVEEREARQRRQQQQQQEQAERQAERQEYESQRAYPTWTANKVLERLANPQGLDDLLKEAIDILSEPLSGETDFYRLGFEPGNTFDSLKKALRDIADSTRVSDQRLLAVGGPQVREQARDLEARLVKIKDSIEHMHNANVQIIKGDMKTFQEAAREITAEQLQVMQEQKGTAQVMRVYEQALQWMIAEKGVVSTDDFDEMMSEHGELWQHMELINREAGLDLQPWQLKWAVATGKYMMNVTMRSAEDISLTKFSDISSFPQESVVRMFNWYAYMFKRFGLSKPSGGYELGDMMMGQFQSDIAREEMGYGEMNLAKVGGQEVAYKEAPSMVNIHGVWGSWRQTDILFEAARVNVEGAKGKFLTMKDYINQCAGTGGQKGVMIAEGKRFEYETADRIRAAFLGPDGTIRRQLNHSLGAIYKHSLLAPQEPGSYPNTDEVNELKSHIRKLIWERAAEDNPLGVVPWISGMVVEDGVGGAAARNDRYVSLTSRLTGKDSQGNLIDPPTNLVWAGQPKTATEPRIIGLREKLVVLNERRLRLIKERKDQGVQITLQDVITQATGEIAITADEQALLDEIIDITKSASTDLAALRISTNPWMNDVLFEEVDHLRAGNEYYARRIRDLGSINSANTNFGEAITNPGGTPPDKMLEIMQALFGGLAGPIGPETAGNLTRYPYRAYKDFIQMNEGERMALFAGYKRITHQANSLAQDYAGMDAPALTELALRKLDDKALQLGILRHDYIDPDTGQYYSDLYDEELRRKRETFPWWIWLIIRDYLPLYSVALLGGVANTTFESVTGKAA